MAPLDRVYQEIAILKKLDHINIVKLTEVSCFSTLSLCSNKSGLYCNKRIFFNRSHFIQNWLKIDVQKFRLVIPSKALLTVQDKLHTHTLCSGLVPRRRQLTVLVEVEVSFDH